MRLDQAGLERWGARVGETIETPVVLALSGPLGAGKSVLARAVGAGAGVRAPMPSPTFNLLFRYPARSGAELVHLDLYRIDAPDELWELGWAQLGTGRELVVVEWPERAAYLLPGDHWWIELSVPAGEPALRDVRARAVGRPPGLAPFPDPAPFSEPARVARP